MATIPVKWFSNLMQGAPQLTNAWGDLVTMLDACLADGFNLKTIASITRSGSVATVTITAGHGYLVEQVVLHAGADQAEYNGEFRVVSVTSTTYTVDITGTPATPATGASITTKAAPLGFEKAFTGTNKRAYRSPNVASNRPYLRVDNSLDPVYTTTYAKKGKVTMAQGMSDIDTFVGARAPYDAALPTKNETGTGSGSTAVDGWYKWYYAHAVLNAGSGTYESAAPNATARSWVLVGDDRGFYLFTDVNPADTNNYRIGYCFTDFESYRAGDGFNTLLCASEFYATASTTVTGAYIDGPCPFNRTLDYTGKVLMRDHVQVGGTVRAGFATLGTLNSQQISGYSTGVPWPNGPDYGLVLHPVHLKQENSHLRGKMPGVMWVHNDVQTGIPDLTIVDSVTGYVGAKFLVVGLGYSSAAANVTRMAFNITGPWW